MDPNTASIEIKEPEATVRLRALYTRPMPTPMRRGAEFDCQADDARRYIDLGWAVIVPSVVGTGVIAPADGEFADMSMLEVTDFPSSGENAGIQIEQTPKPKRRKA